MVIDIVLGFRKLTIIESYVGDTDPTEHLDAFLTMISFLGASNALVCRVFPLNLSKEILTDFSRILLVPLGIGRNCQLNSSITS